MSVTNSQSRTNVHEIAAGIYRISTPVDAVPGGFTFNQILVVDDEPLLFHTGPRRLFPLVKEAVEHVLDDVAKLRYVGFSHFESDEFGSLNEWLALAPRAEPVCSKVAAMVSVNDFADRPPRALADGDELSLGKKGLRWLDAPHVPHNWECGYLFETTTRTLLCGDLFTQPGTDGPPLTEQELVAYWAADLSPADQDRIDEHLLGCEACTAQAARVFAVVRALREVIPPVVSRQMLEALRTRGLAIVESTFAPGERRQALFAPSVDLLVHRLRGLELSDVQRVNVTLRVENSEEVLAEIPDAPFDAREGVLIACQRHYANLPPDVVFEVTAVATSGAQRSARYTILHVYLA